MSAVNWKKGVLKVGWYDIGCSDFGSPFSVEGKQLVTGINHNKVLRQLIFSAIFEAGVQLVTSINDGKTNCDYFGGISGGRILLWKSLIYFLAAVPVFGYCIIVSRFTLARRLRLFGTEERDRTAACSQGKDVIDIRYYHFHLVRECMVGLLLCSLYVSRPFIMFFIQDESVKQLIISTLTITALCTLCCLDFKDHFHHESDVFWRSDFLRGRVSKPRNFLF